MFQIPFALLLDMNKNCLQGREQKAPAGHVLRSFVVYWLFFGNILFISKGCRYWIYWLSHGAKPLSIVSVNSHEQHFSWEQTETAGPPRRRSLRWCRRDSSFKAASHLLSSVLSFEGEGGIFYCISSWYFSGTVVSLSCIVLGSWGECWDCIQIKLICVHKGLSQQTRFSFFFFFF